MEKAKARGLVRSVLIASISIIVLLVSPHPAMAEEQIASDALQPQATTTPIYRLYQHVTGEHLYAQSEYEVQGLVNTHGWKYEGIGWSSPSLGAAVYRLYNPALGSHLYTQSRDEVDNLIAHWGWTADNDGNPLFYSGGSIPVYRLYNEALHGQHFQTTSLDEYNRLPSYGWSQEGVAFYTEIDGNPGAVLPSTGAQPDILLGSFFTNANGGVDTTVFGSVDTEPSDGTVMYALNTCPPQGNGNGGLHDPSIIYKDGYFWMLSGMTRNDGKFWPMISYSKDLVNWTSPEGDGLINGTRGIPLDSMPAGKNGWGFDTVAPEWFVDDDGSVYIVVSCGYYGDFHGEPTVDTMTPYMIKVNQLSASDPVRKCPDGVYYWPENLTFQTGTAQKLTSVINFYGGQPNVIDSTIYKEGGIYYLIVKNNGLYNEIFTSTNPMANNWAPGFRLSEGYEGASLVKFGGEYLLFGDKVQGVTAVGVDMASSGLLSFMNNWRAPLFRDVNNNNIRVRHGSVITLKQGTPGWQVAWNLMVSKGMAV